MITSKDWRGGTPRPGGSRELKSEVCSILSYNGVKTFRNGACIAYLSRR
jgi:hypothetical protein